MLCHQQMNQDQVSSRQTSDYIKILLESRGKNFPSQLVPSELHLELCHVCLLPCVSPLCPSVGARLQRGGGPRGAHLWNGWSPRFPHGFSRLTSTCPLLQLWPLSVPAQLVSGPTYMASADRSDGGKGVRQGEGKELHVARGAGRCNEVVCRAAWASRCDISVNHHPDSTVETNISICVPYCKKEDTLHHVLT